MSEIEKLYESAGVSKEVIPCPAKYYGYTCTKNNWDDADCSCDIEGYPPFTAKKQLELIKLLSQQCDLCINCFRKREFVHYDGQRCLQVSGSSFEETLAGLINTLWQDLTPEEKAEIKEILCE